mgnify:CR=1 FL=1
MGAPEQVTVILGAVWGTRQPEIANISARSAVIDNHMFFMSDPLIVVNTNPLSLSRPPPFMTDPLIEFYDERIFTKNRI